VRFINLTHSQRETAEKLLAEYLSRDEYKGLKRNTRVFHALCGGAARKAIYGNPPNRNQRLGYRTAKRKRARKALLEAYGDPSHDHPVPGVGAISSLNKRSGTK
jgi:hypothetical protein